MMPVRNRFLLLITAALLVLTTSCGKDRAKPAPSPTPKPTKHVIQHTATPKPTVTPRHTPDNPSSITPKPTVNQEESIPVVSNYKSTEVMVNKQRALPANYVPADLVHPNVRYSFAGESEKKLLREPAAHALEQLFAKADEAGITLYGVSGYRSYVTQKAIFNNNVRTQGYTQARRYSAFPGTSEHQTGLSIDVSSASAGYALEEKFGTTPEGKWLQAHCAESGFIIRYPKGKESITGYAYEPWHIRFVGITIASKMMSQGLTLEEYFGDAAAATVQN